MVAEFEADLALDAHLRGDERRQGRRPAARQEAKLLVRVYSRRRVVVVEATRAVEDIFSERR